jgi:hypothetical protein
MEIRTRLMLANSQTKKSAVSVLARKGRKVVPGHKEEGAGGAGMTTDAAAIAPLVVHHGTV